MAEAWVPARRPSSSSSVPGNTRIRRVNLGEGVTRSPVQHVRHSMSLTIRGTMERSSIPRAPTDWTILIQWCVLTNDHPIVPATPNQRVRVPPGQETERPVAGPRRDERSP